MGILSNIYLLDDTQFKTLILTGSFESKGQTHTYDPLGIYYISTILSTEFFDETGCSKLFITPADMIRWEGIPDTQLDWDQTDSTAVDYIKHKPTIPNPYPINEVDVNNTTVMDGLNAKIDLSDLVTQLKTVEGNSLMGSGDIVIDSVRYQTTEPDQDNNSGYYKIAVLDSAPTALKRGYIYSYPE